jgi:fluoride exporter
MEHKMSQWLVIGLGAALGAWLRWGLGLMLNNGILPMGTLAANLVGGLLMGISMAYFLQSSPSAEVRLFVMTGFLGGLTTFSTFSAESFLLFQKQEYWWASVHMGAHVVGSLAMTAIGFWLVNTLKPTA